VFGGVARKERRAGERHTCREANPPWEPERGGMSTSGDGQTRLKWTRQLLTRTPSIRNACDLDLMIFLHRHPRTLLTTEQLAGFVGYNLKEIARSLDSFIEAGLLERTAQQSLHAARLFVLLLEQPQAGGMLTLLEQASTREGRKTILEALKTRDSPRPELRVIESIPRATG
jgi:hypothetical protein